MRVASKVGNLPSKLGHARPLGSRIIRYVRDGRTDRRTDGQKQRLLLPFIYGRSIINTGVVGRFRYIQPVWIACHWLAMSNCCYNPIVYCWMNDKFRYGFRYAFGWCPCVRRPTIPPAMIGSEWVGGRSTMYGGMRMYEMPTRSAGGDGTRDGSAMVVSFRVNRRSPRVETDVVADPRPSRAMSVRADPPRPALTGNAKRTGNSCRELPEETDSSH